MSDTAIRVENLGKRYVIGARQKQAATLRESLKNLVAAPFRYLHSTVRGPSEEEILWALRDVSFEIQQGEAIGVIGRNGAGKSTLLKILSRITEPTTGRVDIYGRVGSLLEVGTGFHPELTGRENVYMNGAILGMSRKEIERKFDEIVAFAEVEKFIDTPVKRYSSGMFVRLGFAVAAHLEPEILIVDEVLAVGDVAFQKKCLGKMGDVTREGRTVLFVSHNMAAVSRLCRWGVWMNRGQLQAMGPAENVIAEYLSSGAEVEGERRWDDADEAPGNDTIRLRSVRVLNTNGEVSSVLDNRQPFCVEFEYDVHRPAPGLRVGFWIVTSDGIIVLSTDDAETPDYEEQRIAPGRYVSSCKIPGSLLNSGTYVITIASLTPHVETYFFEESVLQFQIHFVGSLPGRTADRPPGIIYSNFPWRISGNGQWVMRDEG